IRDFHVTGVQTCALPILNAIALTREAPSARLAQSAAIPVYEDPLDEDDVLDVEVTTSRRGLTRLALVAAETSAHFSREQIGHDQIGRASCRDRGQPPGAA